MCRAGGWTPRVVLGVSEDDAGDVRVQRLRALPAPADHGLPPCPALDVEAVRSATQRAWNPGLGLGRRDSQGVMPVFERSISHGAPSVLQAETPTEHPTPTPAPAYTRKASPTIPQDSGRSHCRTNPSPGPPWYRLHQVVADALARNRTGWTYAVPVVRFERPHVIMIVWHSTLIVLQIKPTRQHHRSRSGRRRARKRAVAMATVDVSALDARSECLPAADCRSQAR